MWFIKNFDQVKKHNFDQTPKLLENFDQLKMSSEIRSTDPLSFEVPINTSYKSMFDNNNCKIYYFIK
jgi:hypothetical protein